MTSTGSTDPTTSPGCPPVVQDDADGHHYTFDYTDIVTEGFRTIRTGERVRFHLAHPGAWRAEFVIRLDQPDPEAYYR